VVNNAGYGLMGAAEELTDQQVRHQIDTNLVGSIQVVRAALPHLRRQGRRTDPAAFEQGWSGRSGLPSVLWKPIANNKLYLRFSIQS
jgi:NAD(P)-dependent dehydrogenase (short-subunit alcohol dehydrogenase family)